MFAQNFIESIEKLGEDEHVKQFGDLPVPRGEIFREYLEKYRKTNAFFLHKAAKSSSDGLLCNVSVSGVVAFMSLQR